MSKADGSWINWFVGLHSNGFLCRVPYEFARDKFNLTGLETMVTNFQDTLDAILNSEFDMQNGFDADDSHPEMAEQLYGLIHARYILTRRGISDMCLKYQRGDFGVCPRTYCNEQLVLPLGLTDRIGESHVKVYCSRCQDIYQPSARCALLDGAMFGSSFPHMFFMQLPHLLPEPPIEKYTPRIYGFKLHDLALLPPSPDESDLGDSTSKEQLKHLEQAQPVQDDNRPSKRRCNFAFD
ncbi:suppressor-of-stellate-like protein [Drosophila hydei]|uniref:Casein kinase II subunit beta n=1 Tax=Drosophila hydei TaxID=7224 RepID=A0A6J1LFM4_DROHY|nr:suppressor-of-stellate-like protein [Drosophila hydei]XP_023165021.2 suppressor-of-stellate-like protein [Drosophila hydei]